ncbi:hypothetical protein [Streptomyces sp. SID13031]|uniref:hypothetical protein n=1 Tax=Streptomyces sp. SID13031 TaxID=2706046 RepID=UPI00194160AC|nr:hypothetical protein [Streptomyces sp. SID13031]
MNARPLILGYIRAHILLTKEEIDAAKVRLTVFASAEGYVLGTVYVEHVTSAPAAFHALLDEVRRDNDIWAVVVPSPQHLAAGGRRAMTSSLEHQGSVHVLVAEQPH